MLLSPYSKKPPADLPQNKTNNFKQTACKISNFLSAKASIEGPLADASGAGAAALAEAPPVGIALGVFSAATAVSTISDSGGAAYYRFLATGQLGPSISFGLQTALGAFIPGASLEGRLSGAAIESTKGVAAYAAGKISDKAFGECPSE